MRSLRIVGANGGPNGDARARRKRRFFLIRVSILLFVLFVVVLYAVRDWWSRKERRSWNRTLDVAVVLVRVDGERRVDEEAIGLLVERSGALEERLHAEAARYRPGSPKPFRFRVFGPVDVASAPPEPEGDGALDLVKHTARLAAWLRDVDPRAGVVPEHWDTRIYVRVRRPAGRKAPAFVEGRSQQNGRIGIVGVDLDAAMVDVTLFVVAHELMHTLGATDKYDDLGRPRVPEGLAEPDRSPLYPQPFAEVMARNRPLSPGKDTIPESLDELAVGPLTAKEIGWVR